MGWVVQGLNPSGGQDINPSQPQDPPSILYNGHQVSFLEGSPSATVEYGVQLYIYLPSVPAWHDSHFKLFLMYRVTGVSQDFSVSAVTSLHAG